MQRTIGGVDVLERLGGRGAAVHRGVQQRSGRVVVVKHAPWANPEDAESLRREAAILARLSHPSLVRLLEVVEDATGRTLVLAHAAGGSLVDRAAAHGHPDAAVVADHGARLASALAVLHGAGVLHRDVSPANVVVDAELVPVLCDLGVALAGGDRAGPYDDTVVGTPGFVDPRVLAGRPADELADLFSLGRVLRHTATGSPDPADGGDLPEALGELLDALEAGHVRDAGEAGAHLDATRRRLGTPHTTTSAAPAAAGPGHRRRSVAGAGDGARVPTGTGPSSRAPSMQRAVPPTKHWGPRPRDLPLDTGTVDLHWLAAAVGAVLLTIAALVLGLQTAAGPTTDDRVSSNAPVLAVTATAEPPATES
jgi:serine/threonine protein kinase